MIIELTTRQSLGYFLAKAIYDIKYGPLSHIPGPKLTALSWFPYVRMLLSGATVPATVRLHKKHGDVVRISPREVSFTSAATAFPDIYGMSKDFIIVGLPVLSIITDDRDVQASAQANSRAMSTCKRIRNGTDRQSRALPQS